MKKYFSCIGLIGKFDSKSALLTHKIIYNWLIIQNYKVILEKNIANRLKLNNAEIGDLKYIGKNSDLAIVVGGDGNMLRAARILSFYKIKVIGINRGNLGFLTEINPNDIYQQLYLVLRGKFYFDSRFLLEISINKNLRSCKRKEIAVNEMVLHSNKITQMFEFEVYIDKKFAFSQRSNGLIISTPTGSTAYSLSAGGPILASSLEAIILISIFPHTLSSRTLIINSNSIVNLLISNKQKKIEIICDGQVNIPINSNDSILIKKSKNHLHLIHLLKFNYFNTLTSKLGWSKKLF